MVLYFSASGNTRYIATMIADRLNDECTDLLERIKTHDYTEVCSDKPFVICTPVYVCEMPVFLRDHLRLMPFRGNRNVYFVFTSGGYAGMSGALAKRMIQKKDMIYMGHAELTMPSNHITSDMYPPTQPEECERRISLSEKKTEDIADTIRRGGRLKARHVFLFEKLVILPFNPIWTKYMMPSKDFHTTDKCMGCGKCSRLCPVNNIRMENRRPVWENPCAHCMACILNCPTEAIEYGNITQKKEKYNIKKYR